MGEKIIIQHDGSWTAEEILRMMKGKFVDRNGKRYGVCRGCRKVVRVDHPIWGNMHFCQ